MKYNPLKLMDDVCDALGLSSRKVRSVTITMDIKSVPLVTVESLVEDESSDALKSVLTNYQLVERP